MARAQDPIDAQLGARLRELRRSRGMTQSELGQAVGRTFQQIQKYEQGTNRLSAPTLLQIAEALETSPLTLFAGAGATAGDGAWAGLSPDERDLLALYRRLGDDATQRALIMLLRAIAGGAP